MKQCYHYQKTLKYEQYLYIILRKINEEKIAEFCDSIDVNKIVSRPKQGFPLNFANGNEEINFVTITQLLNFGSGFRVALHEATGRGAWDTMLFGSIGMFLGGHKLDADYLSKLSLFDLGGIFSLPLDVDEKMEIMPVCS